MCIRDSPKGRRVGIVTNGGGAGVLAADSVELAGLSLAPLTEGTLEYLGEALPPTSSIKNPVDILGNTPPERYAVAVEAVAEDPNVDSVVIITLMQSPSLRPEEVHRAYEGH